MLYNACVDCYLTHACGLMPDAVDANVKPLMDVHKKFWRRVLRLGKKLMLIPLHSETGIIPLRSRRFLILLGYLKYLLSKDCDKYARAALESSRSFAMTGKFSWFKDVNVAGSRLKFDLEPISLEVTDPERIEEYRKVIQRSMEDRVLTEVGNSEKL
ncbi:hypothetical protein ARMGADRAFT_1098208 [Armillaria gallica]|uniref:Uncharacterized protein n=1 Tax=Armillaria gallica TaxID=47427 RepID=A0A2H3CF54_ARMGA|nr:hypothetical protein ARMGADRAFT_1098208 [Armillaria gallica]